MRYIFIFFITILVIAGCSSTVHLAKSDRGQLELYEDTLKQLAYIIVNSQSESRRQDASYAFIPKLVQALKIKGSYKYPFDSVKSIAIINAPDNAFRIFNWQLMFDDGSHRYFGAIQMNNEELELYPLFDKSEEIEYPRDTILDNESWYGNLYYNILLEKHWFKKYYTLLGWDGNNMRSNKKIMDILTFDNDKPVFGAPLFYVEDTATGTNDVYNRFIIEYKENAGVSMNYNKDLDMIIYDHLVPENPLSKGIYSTYIPDGTYHGFEFKRGKWIHIDKVFHQTFEDAPVPEPEKNKNIEENQGPQ